MDFIPWLMLTIAFCALAFYAGQFSKQFPDEDVMLNRLITAEANRRITKRTAADLKAEIDMAAEKIVRQ